MSKQVGVGVGVMIYIDDGYLMLKRIGSHGAGEWSFPGGGLEYGESVTDCAIRETLEETGLTLEDATVFPGFTEDVFPQDDKHYITLYVIGFATGTPRIMEPNKATEMQIVKRHSNLLQPIFSGVTEMWSRLPRTPCRSGLPEDATG